MFSAAFRQFFETTPPLPAHNCATVERSYLPVHRSDTLPYSKLISYGSEMCFEHDG
jgi:hypothetical protein